MALDEAISTGEVKENLHQIEKYFPGEDMAIYDYARFIGTKLTAQESPEEFLLHGNLAIRWLAQGGSPSGDNADVPRYLLEQAPMVCVTMRMAIPRIAKAVCPEDFAAEVHSLHQESITSRSRRVSE